MHPIKPAAMLLGGIAMLTQIVLLRAFMAIFWGNELLVGFLLALWMACSGLGSWLGNRLLARPPQQAIAFAFLLQAFALLCAIAGLLVLPGVRTLLGVPTAEYLTISHLGRLAVLILVPVVLPLGLSFTLLAGAAARDAANPAAQIYLWDAAGAVAASLLFTFALVRWATPVQALLLAALLLTATAAWHSRRRLWLALPAVLLLPLFLIAPGLEEARAAAYWRSFAPGMTLRARAASPHGELAVTEWSGAVSLFANGALQAALPNLIDSQAQAALLLSQPLPAPRRILLIGGGLGGLAPELARPPDVRITCIEPDRQAFALALATWPDSLRARWHNPRLTLLYSDGRHDLQSEPQRYDLIVISAGRPAGALANRYYTEEFFALARERLAPAGILALLNVPCGENYLGPELLRLNRALHAALQRSFSRVIVIPGSEAIYLAGAAVTADPLLLERRLRAQQLDLDYFFPPMFAAWLPADRIAALANQLAGAPAWRNRDFHPIAYFTDLMLWQKMVRGGNALLLALERLGFRGMLLFWSLLLLAAWLAAWRRARQERRAEKRTTRGRTLLPFLLLAAFALGMAATAFDMLFIMALQSLFGNLYTAIGLALAAFMAGMAAGAWLSLRSGPEQRSTRAALLLALIALCAMLLTPFFAFLARHPLQPLFYLGLISASGLTGGLFPLLSGLYEEGRGRGGWGTVNGADLAGGATAALLSGGIWVPLFGFARSLGLVALTALAAALALMIAARPPAKEASHDQNHVGPDRRHETDFRE